MIFFHFIFLTGFTGLSGLSSSPLSGRKWRNPIRLRLTAPKAQLNMGSFNKS
jgi:hypothetical protein